MKKVYNHFNSSQIEEYKDRLHSRIHKLLIFKDPTMKDRYSHVDFDLYFDGLMREIRGFNELVHHAMPVVELMSILEAALLESKSEDYEWPWFRRLILSAHSLVDRIGLETRDGHD